MKECAINISAIGAIETRDFIEDVYQNKTQELMIESGLFDEMNSADKQHCGLTLDYGSKCVDFF